MEPKGIRNISEIGRDRDLDSLCRKSEADGIRGVVRNSEARHIEIADRETAAGLEGLASSQARPPFQVSRCPMSRINGHFALSRFGERRQPAGVITVLVRNQNRGEIGHILADRGQAPRDFPAAQSGVNQHTGSFRRDENGISRATARQNAQLYDRSVPRQQGPSKPA